jgi:hypothetical protein
MPKNTKINLSPIIHSWFSKINSALHKNEKINTKKPPLAGDK